MSEEIMEMTASVSEGEEDVKCIALGAEDLEEGAAVADPLPQDDSVEGRLAAIEDRLMHITNSVDSLFQILKNLRDESNKSQDTHIRETIEKKKQQKKIEIPAGTMLYGTSSKLSYFCEVKEDGFYVGDTCYESLSAAAQGVSGVRRSGWTFWHLPDGKTVKEVYKD